MPLWELGGYLALVTFTVNFAPENWPDPGPSLAELLAAHRWSRELIAIKVNGHPVAKERFEETRLAEGDGVEAFFLVSGG